MSLAKIKSLFVADGVNRGNNINFVRFIAASAVIYAHMAELIGQPAPGLFAHGLGTLAVCVFFILSGYLITTSFLRDGDPFRYMVRRVMRIFPGLIAVIVVTTLVLGPLVSELTPAEYFRDPLTWTYLVDNILMKPVFWLPGVFMDNPYPRAVNGSLWTLPIEFGLYIVIMVFLLVLRGKKTRQVGTWVLAVASSVIAVLIYLDVISTGRVVWGTSIETALTRTPFFFIGAAVAMTPGILKYTNTQVALFAFAVIASVQLTAGDIASFSSTAFGLILCLTVLPYVVFSISIPHEEAVWGKVFAEHDYSYGIYVWAFPVQQTLVWALGPEAMGLHAFALLAFLITLVLAMFSWFLVERPAQNLGRRITKWHRARFQPKPAAQPKAIA